MHTYIKIEEDILKNLLNTQTEILNLLQKKDNKHVDRKDNILTVEEAAKFLKVCKNFVYARTRDGRISSFRAGSDIRINKSELIKFINNSNNKI